MSLFPSQFLLRFIGCENVNLGNENVFGGVSRVIFMGSFIAEDDDEKFIRIEN